MITRATMGYPNFPETKKHTRGTIAGSGKAAHSTWKRGKITSSPRPQRHPTCCVHRVHHAEKRGLEPGKMWLYPTLPIKGPVVAPRKWLFFRSQLMVDDPSRWTQTPSTRRTAVSHITVKPNLQIPPKNAEHDESAHEFL